VNKSYTDEPRRLPAEVPGLDNVAAVVATGGAAALKKDGTVWVWGNNVQAQFGNGRRDDKDHSATPIPVVGVTNVAALAGGVIGRHFLALLKDGTTRVWGNTDWGQVGNGFTGTAQPSIVPLRLKSVSTVFAAGNNSFAILNDGSLWIWRQGSVYGGVWPMKKNAPLPVRLNVPEGVASLDHAAPSSSGSPAK